MTTAVLTADRSRARTGGSGVSEQRLFDDGFTLEDRIVAVWSELAASGSAVCPVCGGTLTPARCEGCGSELS